MVADKVEQILSGLTEAQRSEKGAEAVRYATTIGAASRYDGASRTRLEGTLVQGKVEARRAGRRTLAITATLRAWTNGQPAARR